jgi:hypothetical protein
MTDPEITETYANKVLSEIRHIHMVMIGGVMVAVLCLVLQIAVGLFIWTMVQGPFRQIDELVDINHAIIDATCDSTFYTKEELQRRTSSQQKRLDVVCRTRRIMDTLLHNTSEKSLMLDSLMILPPVKKEP